MKNRYTHTIQLSKNDCGIACIKTILSYYYYDIDYIDIKKKFGDTSNGINILDLKKFFNSIGFETRIYKISYERLVDFDNISDKELPCIILTKNSEGNHYIVLQKLKKSNKCLISDPDHPKIETVKFDELIKKSYFILTIKRTTEIKKCEIIKKYNRNNIMFDIVKKYRKQILHITLMSSLISLVSIAVSTVFGVAVDQILPNLKSLPNLLIVFILIVLLGSNLIAVVLDYYKYNEALLLNNSIEKYIYETFINKLLYLKKNYYHELSSGELIARLKDGMQIIDVVSSLLTNSIIDTFTIVVSIIVLVNISIWLTLTITISIIISVLIINFYYQSILNNSYSISKSYANLDERMIYAISSLETINIFNNEKKEESILNSLVDKYIKDKNENNILFKNEMFFQKIISQLTVVFVMILGIWLIYKQNISIGKLIIFFNVSSMLVQSAANMINVQLNMENFYVSYKRFVSILDNMETINQYNEWVYLKKINKIEFKNVSVKYDNHLLINNINIVLNSSDKNILIDGKSGSGKTTIAKILTKLNENYKGDVFINDINIKDYVNEVIRDNITYVSNELQIPKSSILEYLTDGKKIPIDYVIKVCKDVCILEDILNFPNQFDSKIIESGENLSLGQKQRLCLAHGLLRKPNVIIFDECFSNIDLKTKQTILENLNKYNMNKIFISHQKLEINYDKQFYINNSRIDEVKAK
ncbi:cysteine peptidase family C39 domain-containing protein [Faecalibacillus faecis]|uniref:cysteine peptidase family C39 domain-containing protein n=1 Tax=Faecalibacillus faecis TaxID=1982628 RepID=UPI003863B8E3